MVKLSPNRCPLCRAPFNPPDIYSLPSSHGSDSSGSQGSGDSTRSSQNSQLSSISVDFGPHALKNFHGKRNSVPEYEEVQECQSPAEDFEIVSQFFQFSSSGGHSGSQDHERSQRSQDFGFPNDVGGSGQIQASGLGSVPDNSAIHMPTVLEESAADIVGLSDPHAAFQSQEF
jgi:hypothetical protein